MVEELMLSYQLFESWELSFSIQALLQYIVTQQKPLKSFIKIIHYLNNPLLGYYQLLNNRLFYIIDIQLITSTSYEYKQINYKEYRTEGQRKDDIRYQIEPLVHYINRIFLQLSDQQCQIFYNLYICKQKIDGYQKRTLNNDLKRLIK